MDLAKKACLWGLLGLISLYVPLSFADSAANETAANQDNWQSKWLSSSDQPADGLFFGVEGGWAWPNTANGSSDIYNHASNAPPVNQFDHYTINTPNSTSTWALDAGYRWVRDNSVLPSYSLAVRYQRFNTFKTYGSIEEYSSPEYLNYNYSLNTVSNVFSLLGKVDLYQWGHVAPYFSLGVGASDNKMSDYSEQALPGVNSPRVSPAYQNIDSFNPMFNVGAGVDYFFTQQLWASFGYEYADLGNLQSGTGVGAWAGQSLGFGTLTSSTLLLSFFYQFP